MANISLLELRVAPSDLNVIKYFSVRQSLHFMFDGFDGFVRQFEGILVEYF